VVLLRLLYRDWGCSFSWAVGRGNLRVVDKAEIRACPGMNLCAAQRQLFAEDQISLEAVRTEAPRSAPWCGQS